MTRRWIAPVLVGAGLLVGAGAVTWQAKAEQALVRYPTNLDETMHYSGTFTLFMDPSTSAPLATPKEVPLTVDRHLKADASQSSHDRAVVNESISISAPGVVQTTQQHRYVIDRRSMMNVKDPLSYAFTPSNVVDRSGTYRINLPMNLTGGGSASYPIYKDEMEISYQAAGSAATPTQKVQGLTVVPLTASHDAAPVSEAYLASLRTDVNLPTQMTLDQLKPTLKANGVDVDAVLAALLPVIQPADVATLTALSAKPIPLQYLMQFSGQNESEERTGAFVNVHDVIETLSVRPDPSALPPLITVLQHYPQVPVVASAITSLERMAANPIPVFRDAYSQTPASVNDAVGSIKDQLKKVDLVETWIPIGLWSLAGLLLLAGGAVMLVHHRRGRGHGPGAQLEPVPPEAPSEEAISTPPVTLTEVPAEEEPAEEKEHVGAS